MSTALPDRFGRFLICLLALAGWAGTAAAQTAAQEVEVVFSQVRVSSGEASLEVEFADGTTLEAGFADGEVRVDGSVLGSHEPGGALERSWRALLGEAVSAENGELAGLLAAWTPPDDLSGDEAAVARTLRERLGAALDRAHIADPAQPRTVHPALSPDGELASFLADLSRDSDRLVLVSRGLAEMGMEGITLHLGEDVRIEAGDATPGSVVIVDGELFLEGTVGGDALLVDARLEAGEQGRIDGTLLHARSTLPEEFSALATGVRELELPTPPAPEPAPTRARAPSPPSSPGVFVSTLRSVGSGLMGLLRTGIWFLVLLGIGAAAVHFAPRNMDTIARTAARSPGYSTLVGMAALFLTLPVYILGIIVLTISVVGILALPVWAILFPLVATLATAVGLAAVAWNLGGWYAARNPSQGLDEERPIPLMAAGLLFLLLAFFAAHLLGMGGSFLSFFRGVFLATGILAITGTGIVGLGAVLLSWGGRDDGYARQDREPHAPPPPSAGPRATPGFGREGGHEPA
ncbi:MAG: hypothetical protein EA352_02795 [Gemmatimonadales bacterium]|nr:MAG: hypothetical protein EA352_02795 [Gemmatimonadales bacterium]